jgi:hypothetical protein
VVQVRLPAEFLVEYDAQYTSRRARMDCRSRQNEVTGVVVLCPCFGEVHKDILLWGKRCSMPPGPP